MRDAPLYILKTGKRQNKTVGRQIMEDKINLTIDKETEKAAVRACNNLSEAIFPAVKQIESLTNSVTFKMFDSENRPATKNIDIQKYLYGVSKSITNAYGILCSDTIYAFEKYLNDEESGGWKEGFGCVYSDMFLLSTIKIEGVKDTCYIFEMPFCGHRTPKYNPSHRLPRDMFFERGIETATLKYVHKGGQIEKIKRAAIVLSHVLEAPTKSPVRIDIDNIWTKYIIDGLVSRIIESDSADSLTIISTAAYGAKDRGKEKTTAYITDEKYVPEIWRHIEKKRIVEYT